MAARSAMLRTACVIAAIGAASLGGCASPPEEKAPKAAAAPAPATPKAPAPPPSAAPLPLTEVPIQLAEPQAPAKKRAPKPKPKPPAPEVAKPAPPPPPPPGPSPEEERARKRDAYLAALGRAAFTFNPPSPVQVAQRVPVALSVNPPAEIGQLADELRKSLADADAAAWKPRLRARLVGADFGIAPAEGKNFDGTKDLSTSGRTDWGWTIVSEVPGSKKLIATLSIGLPPSLGGPRELPALQRAVVVESTLGWRAGNLWADYWQWLVAAIVIIGAIAWWARRRRRKGPP